jgi:translation initiation factor 3 subunit G
VLQKSLVDHAVAERKTWAKFGKEKGNKPGPDRATTTVGEFVGLKITAGNKVRESEFLSIPAYTYSVGGT